MAALVVAHLLRNNLHITLLNWRQISWQAVATVPVYLAGFLVYRPYSEVIRHTTLEDILKIFYALSFSVIALVIISYLVPASKYYGISYAILLLRYFVSLTAMTISRIIIKTIFHNYFKQWHYDKAIVIYGAGELGRMAYKAITNDTELRGKVIAFFDDNKTIQGKRLSGVPVYSVEKGFRKVLSGNKVTELIIAISEERLKKSNKRKIINLCLKHNIKVKEVTKVNEWINGGLNTKHFKRVKIEDLLGRDTIRLDRDRIRENLQDSTILVTGAAGSIGSEIVRQLISFNARKVLLLDIAESPLYDLQNELLSSFDKPSFEVLIADVTNKKHLQNIFEKYSPDIVFNAAAYKHVPLMESHPGCAVRVNVGGTKILADLSIKFGVRKFVFISTDKAVNPTNVMGASKRISEVYVQSLAQNNGISTQFITTRFGNVLGSNGSVVPLFEKQIETGGPVTVTHKEITRYFMTIPEACQLVLEAGFMGKGGEIYVFDMGKPVKIYNLAEKMIALSGYIPDKDIKIKITGLRPGEKLYEELLNDKEHVLPTYHKKIMIAKNQAHDYNIINEAVSYLIEQVDDMPEQELVSYMKALVPEFISNNSIHSRLDHKKVPVNRQ
jgi:FlaA1/EpsC-like NDP-sugar epimerase